MTADTPLTEWVIDCSRYRTIRGRLAMRVFDLLNAACERIGHFKGCWLLNHRPGYWLLKWSADNDPRSLSNQKRWAPQNECPLVWRTERWLSKNWTGTDTT